MEIKYRMMDPCMGRPIGPSAKCTRMPQLHKILSDLYAEDYWRVTGERVEAEAKRQGIWVDVVEDIRKRYHAIGEAIDCAESDIYQSVFRMSGRKRSPFVTYTGE